MAKIKGETVMAVLAGIAILYMIYHYSKTKTISGFTDSSFGGSAISGGGGEPAGWASSKQGAVSPGKPETADSLLPRDPNSSWQNNLGEGPLQAMSLLKSGDLIGMQGSVKRNMNLTVRSDPAIPKTNTGPWLQSTIEAVPQIPFEIGSDCKL
jgi:hypothetical protein